MAYGRQPAPANLREKTRRVMQENVGEVRIYAGFFIALIVMYMLFSDGDFSFLLTLSSLISFLSFMIVAYCIKAAGSCKGISLQTIICYVVLLLSRLMSILPFQGYLPSDSSGDFLYQFSEFMSFIFASYICYLIMVKYKDSYEKDIDTMQAKYIMTPCLLLAVVLHPSLNRNFFGDTFWAFALYLETFCVLPQLVMFQATDKANTSTVHFTAAQSAAKILGFIFWLSTYNELNSRGHILKHYVGNWVIFTQFLQILIVADFVYHYMNCITKGIPVERIMTEDV